MSNFFQKSSGDKFKRTLSYGTRRTYLLQLRDFATKTFTYVRPGKTFKTLPRNLKIYFRKMILNYSKEIQLLTNYNKIVSPYVFMEINMKLSQLYFTFVSENGRKKVFIDYLTGKLGIN